MTKEEIKDFINIYYKYTSGIDNKYENAYENDLSFWHEVFQYKSSSYPMETYPEMYQQQLKAVVPKNVRIVNA